MGNDPHCATWIARNGTRRLAKAARRPARRPRGPAEGRSVVTAADALVVFTPSGQRGTFAHGTTVLEAARAARRSTSTRSAAAAGSAGAARSRCARASTRSTAITSTASSLTPVGRGRGALRRRPRPRGRAAARLHRPCGRRPRHRRAAREPALPPGRPQGGGRASDRDRPGRAAVLRRGRGGRARRRRRATSAVLREALAARMGARRARRRPARPPRPAARARAREGGAVTVAVHDGSTITAVWPGFHDRAYGIAFDVGSTTVAGHLCDLATGEVLASAGEMNPQIRFGEDLMSRVSYVMLNPGSREGADEGRPRLPRKADRRARDRARRSTATDVLEVTLVGNPIMHHLLLGIDPTALGGAPFALAVDEAVRLPASRARAARCTRARVSTCCRASPGHVGADAAGVILSEGPYLSDEVNLIVDVGTNAEIVLGNRDRLLAASSPTGPAFEGAQISCGQRAAPGAIERVRIDRGDARAARPGDRVRRVVGRAGVRGTLGHRRLRVGDHRGDRRAASRRRAHHRRHDRRRARRRAPSASSPTAERSPTSCGRASPSSSITQNDVRQIQLAKAALLRGVCAADGALRDRDGSTGSASPARSGRTSTRCTRSCSASCRTAIPSE